MFKLPIPAKIKAIIAMLAALLIVATGVVADEVLDLSDVTTYGIQVVEIFGAYIATFQSPRNRVVLTEGERIQE